MALIKQVVPLSFRQGVDTKTDTKQVVPGKLLTLENGIFQTTSEIRKRNGYLALNTISESGSSISQGVALASLKEELTLFTGSELYSYSNSTQRWTDKGSVTSVSLSTYPVIRNTYSQASCDSAYHTATGLVCFAWEDSSGGSKYTIFDSSTQKSILADQLISSTAVKPKVMTIGNFLVVFYVDTATNHLKYIGVPVSTPTVPNSTLDVATNLAAPYNYDVAPIGARLYIAHSTNASATTVHYLDSFLSLSAGLTESANSTTCINITGDTTNQNVWVTCYDGSTINYFVCDYTLRSTLIQTVTPLATISNVRNLTMYTSAGSGQLFHEVSAGTSYNNLINTLSVSLGGSPSSSTVLVRSLGLASKSFKYNGVVYFLATFESPLQSRYFLVTGAGKIAAKLSGEPNLGGGLTKKSILPEINQVTDGEYQFAYLQTDSLVTVSGTPVTRTGVMSGSFDFTDVSQFNSLELGSALHTTGGFVSMYDSATVVEHGFHVYPEGLSTNITTTGGNLSAGQYQYCATYEWTDNKGQVHRSAQSIPSTITTTGATSQCAVTIPTLRLTSKQGTRSPVQVVLYRTAANGTIFYQVGSITNDTTVDTVSITDTQADAAILGNTQLYTTGEIENISAPATGVIGTYNNRVILVPSEAPGTWWYSKQVIPGSPVEFSESFVKNMDPRGGDLTGTVQMDDKLILFKENAIFYTTGDGAAASGLGDTFAEPQIVSLDVGCSNTRSIVLAPAGLMFQSAKGIYLLDHGLNLVYVGRDVELYNSDTVNSAKLVPSVSQVRFVMASGVALVFDYLALQWSVFTNHSGVDSAVLNDTFQFLQSSGTVQQETPGLFADNGSPIKLRIVTSWLSFAGLQGFQRVWKMLVLGEYKSPHRLKMSVAYDFNPVFTQEAVMDTATIFNPTTYGADGPYGSESVYGGVAPTYQFRLDFIQQQCQSLQIAIEDIQTSIIGEGYSLSAATFEVGLKRGMNKVSSARSFG